MVRSGKNLATEATAGGKKLELMAYFYYIAQISFFLELVGETGREMKDIFLFSSLGTAAGKTYSVSYFQMLGRRMVLKRTHKHSQNIHSVNNCK